MRALQDRCVANEKVIRQFRKHQEIEKKERAQHSEAVRTLNKELMAKSTMLAEETLQLEEVEKAKTNLATELAALLEQVEKARVDAMAEFRISQPFFDACGVYYGERFKDCQKQVRAAYPNLDLSQITIDDTVLLMPVGDDTVNDEIVNSIHTVDQEVRDIDDVVIAQPVLKGPDAGMLLFVVDLMTANGLSALNPITLDAPDAPLS